MKNNKGITLIALVITIIVLLILAGITIAMLTGDNGLLTKSNEAKITDLEAAATEKVRLAVAAMNLEYRTQLVTKSDYNPIGDSGMLKVLNDDLTPDGDWGKAEAIAATTTVTFKNDEYVSAKGTSKTFTIKVTDKGISLDE